MTTRTLDDAMVLAAEDDPRDVLLLERAFRKAELQNPLRIVSDGAEAIAYLACDGRFRDRAVYPMPVVLLLDLRMPKISGYEVLAWISQQRHLDGLLTAVVTSIRDVPYVERAYELGAKAFLVKPIQPLDLCEVMERFKRNWIVDVGNVPVAA